MKRLVIFVDHYFPMFPLTIFFSNFLLPDSRGWWGMWLLSTQLSTISHRRGSFDGGNFFVFTVVTTLTVTIRLETRNHTVWIR